MSEKKQHGLTGKVNNPKGRGKGPEMESLHIRVPKGSRDSWRTKIMAYIKENPLPE